jgi:hypothetical protein
MMRSILFPSIACLLLAAGVASAATPASRDVGDIVVRTTSRSSSGLSSLLGPGHSILIVLDARSGLSRQWIDEVRRSGFAGEGALIIVLGATANDLDALQSLSGWAQARWFRAEAMTTLRALQTQGTPGVYGLAGTQMRWAQSGMPARGGEALVLRMLDWLVQQHAASEPQS